MDPVNAGASVLAFFVLALKSAKVIHEVLSAVKDGPENVRHLVNDVAQLRGILERLSRLPLGPTHAGGDAQALEAVVKRCADDVGSIESRLQRLSILPTDKRVGKLWKRLAAAIGEKDLAQMQDTVRGHYMMLNVHLLLAQAAQMSTSRDQCSEILEHVKELKEEVMSVLRPNSGRTNDFQGRSSTTDATTEPSATPAVDSELERSISRLIELIGEKESTVAFDDAEQMIDDLQALLKAAEKVESSPPGRAPPANFSAVGENHTCVHCGQGENSSRDLKLIRGLLASAPSVAVNKTGPSPILTAIEPGTIISQNRKRKYIEIPDGGRLSLYTNRRTRRRRDTSDNPESHDHGRTTDGRDFIAKIIFRPSNTKSMLVVSVNQAQLVAGSFSSIPNLSLQNIIPNNSEIFSLARKGNIGGIMKLVAEPKASLHDRDENGWSLLHHGFQHPALCRFLVQNGLDVDDIAGPGHEITPLHLAMSKTDLEATRALLQVGADPTIRCKTWISVAFFVSREMMGLEFLRQIFDIAPHFINPRERDRQGGSMFLLACEPIDGFNPRSWCRFESQSNIQKLAILLEHGASVHDRDDNGSTCLHRFFSAFFAPPDRENWQDWQESLIYLILQGADVHAKDNKGMSVSDVAYSPSCQDFGSSSYRGDLWDAVLNACGYDLQEFRKGYPREAEYSESYGIYEFRSLWKGREERCPYFYDKYWATPYDGPGGDHNKTPELLHHCDGVAPCRVSECEMEDSEEPSLEDEIDEETEDEESQRDSPLLLDADHDEDDTAGSRESTTSWPWTLEQISRHMPPQGSGRGLPYIGSAAGAGQFHNYALDETAAAPSHLRSTVIQYGDIFNNPWLDDDDTRRVCEVQEGEGEGDDDQTMAFSPWTD